MPKMHELLAVIGDTSTAASAILKETETTFSKKPEHFKGQTRAITFFDEARAAENVSETKEVVTTVMDKLDYTFKSVGRYWDALLQLETTNGVARADLMVDGNVLATDVPATFLLGMETRLKELRAVLLTIPTLAPELAWSKDETADFTYVSPPQVNFRGEKTMKYKVLYEATDKHPAQIEKWNEDVPVARIETTHRSTMLTPSQKSQMLMRCDSLIAGVKAARQRANTAEVERREIAATMFTYIANG